MELAAVIAAPWAGIAFCRQIKLKETNEAAAFHRLRPSGIVIRTASLPRRG